MRFVFYSFNESKVSTVGHPRQGEERGFCDESNNVRIVMNSLILCDENQGIADKNRKSLLHVMISNKEKTVVESYRNLCNAFEGDGGDQWRRWFLRYGLVTEALKTNHMVGVTRCVM